MPPSNTARKSSSKKGGGKGRSKGKSTASSKRRSSSARRANQSQRADGEVFLFVFTLLMSLLCLLLFISSFGNGGYIGRAICAMEYGLVGSLARVFPFLLLFGHIFLLANYKNPRAYKRICAGIGFFILICGLVQMLTQGVDPASSVGDYFAISSDYHTGGGAVGGAITLALVTAFGHLGGMIVLGLGLAACLIWMTNDSLVEFLLGITEMLPLPGRLEDEDEEDSDYERSLRREVREQERNRRREEKRLRRIEKLEEQLQRERAYLE